MKPWERYGHDRLYVQTADGTRLGYLDHKTGATVLEDQAHRDAFNAALVAHRDTGVVPLATAPPAIPVQVTASALPAPPLVAAAAPLPRPDATVVGAVSGCEEAAAAAPETDWNDLAAIKAGAAAREQAVALKRAAPVTTFLARALGVKTDERAWRIGADAEEAVAARLARLDDRWKVLHAVPVGENGSDIDHVVIGPGGVFTINTKNHPDASIWLGGTTFMVNGTRVPYVRNSKFEAKRTSRFLAAALGGVPVHVTGLIAVMGATGGYTIKNQPPDGDVVVLTRKEVAKWLAKHLKVLTDEQVEAIYAVARRSDTWREQPEAKAPRRRRG